MNVCAPGEAIAGPWAPCSFSSSSGTSRSTSTPLRVLSGRPMRRFLAWWWAVSIALSGCGSCSGFPLLPDKRTSVNRAHQLDDICAEDAGPLPADALSPSVIESVQAAYMHVNAGAGGDLRLRGVNLHMRPTVNTPVGVLQRSLECHEAAVT